MFFRTATIISTVAVLFVGQAMGAALIATDPVSACGPPNNADHHAGSSCKFFAGPSDSSPVISGSCVDRSGTLTCVA
ncbi:hypothetical protein V5O48_010268 [Marasmius crinis-equi]|uniref:Uncharacterized protein n=1 Tax=Marasmius crinis-equi TaxID=585013 RepID=A0ABR3F8W8_9AGAR